MELLGYLGAVAMGVSLGLIGGGGSILSVPIFVYLFGVPPVLATAYSLFVVGATSLVGGLRYAQNKKVDFKTGLLFALPAFVGVFMVRRFLVPSLPEQIVSMSFGELTKDMLIMGVFAMVMLMASYSMIKPKKATPANSPRLRPSPTGRVLIIAAEGLFVGGLTGFVGAGGGFLIVPALVLLTGLSMRVAIGTSLFIISFKSLFGFLGDVGHQDIDWLFLGSFSALSIVGIFAGVYMNRFVSETKLKVAFGWFVLVMGFFILLSQLWNT